MHYLELVSSVDPRSGGVIAGITALARERAINGDRTTVVSLDPPGAFTAADMPFTWVGLGPPRSRYRYAAGYVPWLREHASTYDTVIVNGLWQYHSFGAWRALADLGVPYLVFPHGMLDPWFKRRYPLKHLKKLLYWWWADYRVVRDARAVCFTCDQERLLARESFSRYRAREVVVGYGIDAPPAAEPGQIEAFTRLVPASAGKRVMLFLSRIQEKKGCDLLLQAFAAVCSADASWHLVMAGPDQDGWQTRLQQMASDLGIAARVSWPGMLVGSAKWGAYRSADTFVLPSHQENFGVVVAEALACGCPVLISDQVNIWREVVSGGAGFAAPDTLAGTTELLRRWSGLSPVDAAACRERTTSVFREHFHMATASARIRAAATEHR